MFDDWFETVQNEPNDTSVWQKKAYFRKHVSDKTNDLLISNPTNAQAPTPRLPPYASEIPAALLQLPDPSVHQANEEPDQVTIPEASEPLQAAADLPQAVHAAPEPPGAPSPTYPINIAPTCRVPRKNRTCWYCRSPSSGLSSNGQC